jgi:hypothetical protein
MLPLQHNDVADATSFSAGSQPLMNVFNFSLDLQAAITNT